MHHFKQRVICIGINTPQMNNDYCHPIEINTRNHLFLIASYGFVHIVKKYSTWFSWSGFICKLSVKCLSNALKVLI